MDETNLDWMTIVADRAIKEAMEEGVFDNLPGKEKPIDLEADSQIPGHLRIAHKILKNAGAVPEWFQVQKEIEREAEEVKTLKERGLRALQSARNAASRERIVSRLRSQLREHMDLHNTLVLQYNLAVPSSAQCAFRTFNVRREMAELEDALTRTNS